MIVLKSLFISSSKEEAKDFVTYFNSVQQALDCCKENAVDQVSKVIRDWEYSDQYEELPIVERVLLTPAGQTLIETIIQMPDEEWEEWE